MWLGLLPVPVGVVDLSCSHAGDNRDASHTAELEDGPRLCDGNGVSESRAIAYRKGLDT